MYIYLGNMNFLCPKYTICDIKFGDVNNKIYMYV